MNVVLISTYELGHQPFGLASPAAFLRELGTSVSCFDLALECLSIQSIQEAELVAFYVPMHTATRIAVEVIEKVKQINPDAHLCFYGLYAPMNEPFLRSLGAATILGGEFEEGLVSLVRRLSQRPVTSGIETAPQAEPVVSVNKQQFRVPDRTSLPPLQQYAYLTTGNGERRTVGYTEATRGCKHLCRHCPIVPVYQGRFRIVQEEIVLEDIARQVAQGAQHITFGDPDFFNGPRHALHIVTAMHERFPELTFDVTIKIEHLLKDASQLEVLRDSGCLFVTSAVESVDDEILKAFDKNHTREMFFEVVALFREVDLTLHPTFVAFNPWITVTGYLDLLQTLYELDLVDNVPSIQYAIRLLIPAGSRILELPFIAELVDAFDESALYYLWAHPDPRVDELQQEVMEAIRSSQTLGATRRQIFDQIWTLAQRYAGVAEILHLQSTEHRSAIPHLSEPWYCCAEPTEGHITKTFF